MSHQLDKFILKNLILKLPIFLLFAYDFNLILKLENHSKLYRLTFFKYNIFYNNFYIFKQNIFEFFEFYQIIDIFLPNHH